MDYAGAVALARVGLALTWSFLKFVFAEARPYFDAV